MRLAIESLSLGGFVIFSTIFSSLGSYSEVMWRSRNCKTFCGR